MVDRVRKVFYTTSTYEFHRTLARHVCQICGGQHKLWAKFRQTTRRVCTIRENDCSWTNHSCVKHVHFLKVEQKEHRNISAGGNEEPFLQAPGHVANWYTACRCGTKWEQLPDDNRTLAVDDGPCMCICVTRVSASSKRYRKLKRAHSGIHGKSFRHATCHHTSARLPAWWEWLRPKLHCLRKAWGRARFPSGLACGTRRSSLTGGYLLSKTAP